MGYIFRDNSLKESEKKRGQNPREDRGRKDVNPNGQSPRGLLALCPPGPGFIPGGITADRAAPFKECFLADETAGGAADGREIPPAFGAVLRVPGYLGIAALAEKTGAFGRH
jgi:hypothetical protein